MVIYEKLSPIMAMSQRYFSGFNTNRSQKRFGICASPGFEFACFESPVQVWLNELQSLTEVESLSALQAKSVATTPESFEALSIRNAQVSIQQIRHNSTIIIDELDSLIDSLPVYCDGCDYVANKQLSIDVIVICEQTIRFMKNFLWKQNVNNAQIEANVRKLKESFGELVDVTIKKESLILVSSLNKKTSRLCLKWSLLALWQLTQKDPYMCRLFIENQKIINYLLDIVQNYCNVSLSESYQIKAAALRVLTYLSANRDAVRQILREFIGNKCLISMILNETEEMVQREIVGFLVQVTTVFIDNNKDKIINMDEMGSLNSKSLINELVNGLTDILKTAINDQIFLMACAALANVSFMNTDSLIKYDTLTIVLNSARQRFESSDQPLLKDQIITLLANMSQKHQLLVVSSGGLIFLIQTLLTVNAIDGMERTKMLSVERIQQKIAVALARLGTHKSTAKIIYKLNGVSRLIQLCKEPKERNYSDTVLLASIAALKRIAQSIGRLAFKELNACDLIDSKLQDTFIQYSIKNESLV
ncbi:inscuteable-like protein [Dermatophagoides farinae]|uniref:Inscuteable-like protein n=1 Tax=Dermatophagoides farinae TaxID=6954 RepID=A0A9D4P3K8_DERFA|nr:inscuteable-like protein [Dermatophagoides farinae]